MNSWSCKKIASLESKVNFKIYDVRTWLTNKYNTYVTQTQYLKVTQSKGNQTMKLGQLIEYNKINIFL